MNIEQLKQEFASPSNAYRSKPFWAWNGELRGEELIRQAKIMKEMGMGGYFMHSRAGLITEYLSEEWFELINELADTAQCDCMEAWLYDEDRWPSGSAGGKVTIDPGYRMKSLRVYEMSPETYEAAEDTYALFLAKMDGINMWAYKEIDKETADVSAVIVQVESEISIGVSDIPGEWKVLRFAIDLDTCSSNYNGTTYLDTMSLKATEKFIELTHEEYSRHCGDRLGRSIKGIFIDEPHRGHCLDDRQEDDGVISCSMCWTDDILDEFKKRYGYDARPIIPELYYRFKGEKVAQIKLHYIDLANNLFIERFVKPINEWCEDHNIILTGHALHENSLMNQTVPNGSVMRFYEHMGYPGVDYLGEHGREYWIVKQLSSAARQLGKKWLLSELYGCIGWQSDFKSHKTVGDWQALLGINLRCPHLSWYTMEGEAKRDYPASILHQSPWYHDYAAVEDYFARFGLVISEGKPTCDVLVLNPIESVWCQAYAGWAKWIYNSSPDIEPYEERYERLCNMLLGNQIDFDYGEEQMMEVIGSVKRDAEGHVVLCVGEQCYRTVLVGNMLTIRPNTLSLLEKFIDMGGSVIFAGEVPDYVDAALSDAARNLSNRGICVPFEEEAIISAIRSTSNEYISVINASGNTEKDILVQVRKDFGGKGYAIVLLNTDRNRAKNDLLLSFKVPSGYQLQEWDFEDGTRWNANKLVRQADQMISISLSLEAAGTRCFILTLSDEKNIPETREYETLVETVIDGEFSYSMDEKNVCVLDWVKWRWKGCVFSEEKEVLKADRAVRDSIGLEYRGGQMLQPWFAKLHDTQKYGELELEYEFEIEKLPEGDVYLAGERPELNIYKINGVVLSNENRNDFWIDDCFKKMKIPEGTLKTGRNIVAVNVDFMCTTNIEALYLIGDFGVSIDGRRRVLVDLPKTIGYRNYEDYNLPFYTGSMTFHLTPDMYRGKLDISSGDRIVLSPLDFTGGCAKVTTLGKTTVLGWDPYEADVTEAVRAAEPIDVTIVGTRRNVFGPLHQVPKLVQPHGPASFHTKGEKWTDDYSLFDSGLRGIALKIKKDIVRGL
ncbi:MAG: hypothetical protein J6C37_05360 [Roseburia sp.]|nr:hypothetical protein [Roseburia sp.]